MPPDRKSDDPETPAVWRSVEEFAGEVDMRRFIEGEFLEPVAVKGVDRRAAMRLMGASLALAGLSGCGGEARFGAPLLSQPRNVGWPGESLSYATSLELDGYGRGVLVQTVDGRPVKIEGNPLHPASLGATDVFMQAELLSLYDPDRTRLPFHMGREQSWSDLWAMLAAERTRLAAARGKGLALLLGPTGSPTMQSLLEAMTAIYPEARVFSWHPVADDNAHRGALHAFGRDVACIYDLRQADVVLSLGADIVGPGPMQVRHASDLAQRRRQGRDGGRLPVLHAAMVTPGLTGARADRRIVLHPSEMEPFVRAVAASLGLQAGAHPAQSRAAEVAADLQAAGSRALVVAGRDQPASVHALAHAINARLGAIGQTVRLIEPVRSGSDGAAASLVALSEAIGAGNVTHLAVLGANPVYDGPVELQLRDLVARVPVSLHLGLTRDETARACRWHIPMRHALECWGDTRAFDGTVGLRQPVTRPLLDGVSDIELVSVLSGGPAEGHRLVQAQWRARWGESFDERWAAVLEAGVVADSAAPFVTVQLRDDWANASASPPAASRLVVHFAPDASVWDGRFAGNAWLQELPDPLSKQVWGNAARIAPLTAAVLGLTTGDVVELDVGGRRLEIPVWVLPGQAPDTVTLPLGYGRPHAGRIGSGVGVDAYQIRSAADPWVTRAIALTRTGRKQQLVSTQHHHAMEGRDIVRVVAPGQPATPAAPQPQPSLYPDFRYDGHAWGMSIDLDGCIGCNACVVACQAENNVAVVGPDEVARGREMHWLRIDRYYAGRPEAPAAYFQPVPCMHCEKAPCEVVCPVNATVHSSEGLNDMVYNRCVGTRTCSNNCPYKVRRFNWYDYARTVYTPPGGTPNPEVTVRPLGVMEKCTYCVQRISEGRIAARIEGRALRDGEVRTACQQACPTQAIVFGDLNDPGSAVARHKADPRNYALLGELNTRPRTTYLARIGPARSALEDT